MKSQNVHRRARVSLVIATCFLNALGGQPGIDVSSEARPWVWLRLLQTRPPQLLGQETLLQKLSPMGRPTALASADFDEDGVPDLACGYSIGETGLLSLHRGNKDPIYPHSERSRQRRLEGTFLSDPFFPEARFLDLPSAPDLLGAGDFDGDRHWDLVLATRGKNKLWHLPGRGDGTFDTVQAMSLPGEITAMLVADLNRRDLRSDIVVGLIKEEGPRLLIFQTPWGALDRAHGIPPEELLIDSIPNTLAAEDLDGDYRIDLAVGHGDAVTVFFGRDRKLLWPGPVRDQVESAREDNIFFDAPIRSLAIGDFVGDGRRELAVLTRDEPFLIRRKDEGLWTRRSLGREDISYGVEAQLLQARFSTLRKDDLLILDPEQRHIEIWVEESGEGRRLLPDSFPDRTIRSWIRSVDAPVSVLPMRFNPDGLTDLVLLTDSPDPLSFLVTQGNETILVDTDGSEFSFQNDDTCDADADPENGKQCTLPEAIRTANNRGGLDTIQFAISQINLTERLPSIVDPVVIDGTSAGLVTLTPIEQFASGLLDLGEGASGSTIRGMKTNVKIAGGSNNIIEGNQLGVSTGGSFIEPAVLIRGGESSKNLIGGTTDEARNILIGGEFAVGGVEIGSNFTSRRDDITRTMIFGNYIGTDATGTRVSGFGAGGIIFPPNSDNQIGGLAPGQGNLIAGSEGRGVLLARQTSDNIVAGNRIGTDPTGTFTNPDRFSGECPDRTSGCSPTRLGNRLAGVEAEAQDGRDHQIVENLISGNGHSEIFPISGIGTGSNGTIIRDNRIGTDILGTTIDPDGVPDNGDELGNGVGITVSGTGVMVTGNLIAGNAREGIRVRGEDTTAPLTQNRIWENGELGIDLGNDGITENDEDDLDPGPNRLQNFPELQEADSDGVRLKFDGGAGQFRLEFFVNDQCDPSGHGEGQELIHSEDVVSDDFDFAIPLQLGKFITATATKLEDGIPTDTSEFSNCLEVGESVPPPMFVVNSTGDRVDQSQGDGECDTGRTVGGEAECTLRAAIEESNADPDKNTINFRQGLMIQVSTDLPLINQAVEIDGTGSGVVLSGTRDEQNDLRQSGLALGGGGSTVRGMTIRDFDFGIGMGLEKGGNKVAGNWIHEVNVGILVDSGSGDNTIGGPVDDLQSCPDPCNRIYNYRTGIVLSGHKNTVQGNLIGTDHGTADKGGDTGIKVTGENNQIGGRRGSEGNVISGNGTGIELRGSEENTALNNRIQGNYIGLTADGTDLLANDLSIQIIGDAKSNLIGGLDPDQGNDFGFEPEVMPPILEPIPVRVRVGQAILFGIGGFFGPMVEGCFSGANRILSNLFRPNPKATAEGKALSFAIEAVTHFGVDSLFDKCKPATPPRLKAVAPGDEASGPAKPRVEFNVLQRAEGDGVVQVFSGPTCDLAGQKLIVSQNVSQGRTKATLELDELNPGDFVAATFTSPARGTSLFTKCIEILEDTDGDGLADVDEAAACDGGDCNNDGIADRLQAEVGSAVIGGTNVAVSSLREELIADIFFELSDTSSLERLGEDALFLAVARIVARIRQQNEPASFPVQQDSVQIVMHLPPDVRVDSYFNFGPTPEDPKDHFYEFLLDGTTGAEIFEDRIVLHFVDGQRGDHDLTVNGVIETLGGPTTQSRTFFFPQVGDGLAGNIQFQTSLILNNPGPFGPAIIELFDSTGNFFTTDFDTLGNGSLFVSALDPNGSLIAQSEGSASLQVGFARVDAVDGVGGTAVFSRTDAVAGVLLYEAGVAAAETLTDFSLVVDTRGNRDTGLAIAYPDTGSDDDANLTLRLYDASAQLLGTEILTMSPGTHLAQFVPEIFGAVPVSEDLQGSLTVESDQPIVAVTLRQTDKPGVEFPDEVPTLTTFPVLAGRADDESSLVVRGGQEEVFYFPQVGDGRFENIRFATGLIFLNTGETAQIRVEFFDPMGAPMEFDFGSNGKVFGFDLNLPTGALVELESPASGDLQIGYARITTLETVGGLAVFARSEAGSGTLLYEAGVPASRPLSSFSVVVDTRGDRNTGLAILNPPDGGPTANVTLKLFDASARLLAKEMIALTDGGQLARFVDELFPEIEGISEMSGSLLIESDVPLAAVTLRQNDSGLSFPAAVPTLATFPVVPTPIQ